MKRKYCVILLFIVPATLWPLDQNSETKNSDVEKKIYQTIKYKPGYYQGIFMISMMSGSTLSPSGSFINHEKDYDLALKNRVLTGDIRQSYVGTPAQYYQAEYTPGDSGQIDLEYGFTDHIGLGFSLFQYALYSSRQDVLNQGPGTFTTFSSQDFVDPVPQKRRLYRGSTAAFLTTYHFFSKSFFDPYISVKAGVVAFTGEAHASLYNDKTRLTNKINNGLGSHLGAGIGLNIHFGRYWGLKTDVSYSKQYLHSDLFWDKLLYFFSFFHDQS